MPLAWASAVIRWRAWSEGAPSHGPECTRTPSFDTASVSAASSGTSPPAGATTTRIGSRYFRANSKSRSSWAGTAMTAPVPYSPSTKLATQIGTCSPLNGFIAWKPVKNPSFSASPETRAMRSCVRNRVASARIRSPSDDAPANISTSGCSGATRTNVAPKMVSMRVVNTSMSAGAPAGASGSPKRTRAPSDRPIQFRCIVRTLSGQWVSVSSAASNSSAYAVILRNHCSRSRVTTVVPQRQQAPSTTCSLASTVRSTGHQFTVERRRYASPRSYMRMNSHWFQW